MTTFTAGERIALIAMPNDPAPVPPGSMGTIVSVGPTFPDGSVHLVVRWDDSVGRTLNLVVPPDEVQRMSELMVDGDEAFENRWVLRETRGDEEDQ